MRRPEIEPVYVPLVLRSHVRWDELPDEFIIITSDIGNINFYLIKMTFKWDSDRDPEIFEKIPKEYEYGRKQYRYENGMWRSEIDLKRPSNCLEEAVIRAGLDGLECFYAPILNTNNGLIDSYNFDLYPQQVEHDETVLVRV